MAARDGEAVVGRTDVSGKGKIPCPKVDCKRIKKQGRNEDCGVNCEVVERDIFGRRVGAAEVGASVLLRGRPAVLDSVEKTYPGKNGQLFNLPMNKLAQRFAGVVSRLVVGGINPFYLSRRFERFSNECLKFR